MTEEKTKQRNMTRNMVPKRARIKHQRTMGDRIAHIVVRGGFNTYNSTLYNVLVHRGIISRQLALPFLVSCKVISPVLNTYCDTHRINRFWSSLVPVPADEFAAS